MGIQVTSTEFGVNGHADAMAKFRSAHLENSEQLLKYSELVTAGKPVSPAALREPRPAYDPTHPDNQWPLMVHHPVKGEKTIGTTLKGVDDQKQRITIQKNNDAALAQAIQEGYRKEPYPKPQITVLDPAAEKLAAQKRADELAGQNASLQDALNKLTARMELMEKGKGA